MRDRQSSAVAKIAVRVFGAAAAVGSLVVLLDAGAKYPALGWSDASFAREPSALEEEVTAPSFTPREFRLSANFSLDHAPSLCAEPDAALQSQSGDGAFDNSCPTVKAVGELPVTELLSWADDSLYHRAVRF